MRSAVVLVALAACGGPHPTPTTAIETPATPGERILGLLPQGAQVVVELDLARLRANPVVGDVTSRALGQLGADAHLPGLPVSIVGSPLGTADLVVLAAYGVGTHDAATLTVLQTKADVPGGTRITPDLVAVGPDDWVSQLQTRAAVATPLQMPSEMRRLRDHAMPQGATGAVLRVTARLPFDARVALARETGIDDAPAQLSVWADVADDMAVVIDADAADPGDRNARTAARRLAHSIRITLGTVADQPMMRALGVPASLTEARLIAQGSWVRAIIAVGPRHLARVVERARAMLGGAS